MCKLQNIFSHAAVVSREQKQQVAKQRSFCVWCTGTSASGKTAINKELEQLLAENSFLTMFLDGDNLRLVAAAVHKPWPASQ